MNKTTEDTNIEEQDAKLLELQLKVWEKAVDTQMHFNDMCHKARQHGVSIVVVIIGFAMVLLLRTQGSYFFTLTFLPNHPIHISTFITLLPPFVMWTVRELDLYVYHMMLRGAVTFGENFEQCQLRDKILKTHQGMTQLISLYSRHKDVKIEELEDYSGALQGKKYKGDCSTSAQNKIKRFYNWSILLLLTLPVLLFFISPKIAN